MRHDDRTPRDARKVDEVDVVPGWPNRTELRRFGRNVRDVPGNAKPVAVERLGTHAGAKTLVGDRMRGSRRQQIQSNRRTHVERESAHSLSLTSRVDTSLYFCI